MLQHFCPNLICSCRHRYSMFTVYSIYCELFVRLHNPDLITWGSLLVVSMSDMPTPTIQEFPC